MDREEVKKILNLDKIYFEAFFYDCPFTLSSLKTRKKEQPLVTYRQMGYFWIWLTGVSLEKTASYFNRDHTTVSLAIETVFSQIHTTYKNIFKIVVNANKKLIESDNAAFYETFSKDILSKQEDITFRIESLEKTLESCQVELTNLKKEL